MDDAQLMAPEVFLDGEPVAFAGEIPPTLGELHALLSDVLAQQSRLIAAAVVDGREWNDQLAHEPMAGVRRIELASMSVEEAVAQIAAAVGADAQAAREQADALSSDVLRVPWSEAQPRCGELAAALSRVLEGATTIAAQSNAVGPAAESAHQLAGAVHSWMEATRAKDAAGVTLQLAREVLPALDAVARLVRREAPVAPPDPGSSSS